MSSESLMHEAGYSRPVFWDNSEEWGVEGSGKGAQDGGKQVHPGLIHVDVWQKTHNFIKHLASN